MAKGRVGGAHSKIRGKVGSQVYQIKKDYTGRLMQHVYSAAEQREYTNTDAQVLARMRMGMIHRMYKHLAPLLKESFISVPRGTLSLQHFSRINYPLLTADLEKADDVQHDFDWIAKYNLSAPAGRWLIAQGVLPSLAGYSIEYDEEFNGTITLVADHVDPDITLADFLSSMNLDFRDNLTIFAYYRKWYNPDDDEEVDLSSLFAGIDSISFNISGSLYRNYPIQNVDFDRIFVHDDSWFVLAQYRRSDRQFLLQMQRLRQQDDYQVACIAPLIVRSVNGRILWSTSQFEWGNGFVSERYPIHTPSDVFTSWKELTPR